MLNYILSFVAFVFIQLSNQANDIDFERQPGLGRIINLGSVYYAADERLAFDENLWKMDTLKRKSTIQPITYSTSKLKFVRNKLDKFQFFNVGASVTVGLLSDLITIKGSAEYLRDDKQNNEQSHIAMYYKSITSSEYLSQDLRKSLDFDEVCDLAYDKQNPATHIVSSITRGFQGNDLLMLDRKQGSNERFV